MPNLKDELRYVAEIVTRQQDVIYSPVFERIHRNSHPLYCDLDAEINSSYANILLTSLPGMPVVLPPVGFNDVSQIWLRAARFGANSFTCDLIAEAHSPTALSPQHRYRRDVVSFGIISDTEGDIEERVQAMIVNFANELSEYGYEMKQKHAFPRREYRLYNSESLMPHTP